MNPKYLQYNKCNILRNIKNYPDYLLANSFIISYFCKFAEFLTKLINNPVLRVLGKNNYVIVIVIIVNIKL